VEAGALPEGGAEAGEEGTGEAVVIWILIAFLLVAGGLAWMLSVAQEELAVSRTRAAELAHEVDVGRERSVAEVERRVAERRAELDAWAQAERLRWVEQERAQVVADAEARAGHKFDAWKFEAEGAIRKDAVARSTSVIRGNVSEQLLPFMDAFPYDPRDCRFIGAPIDLIVFNGLYGDGLTEIVFLEVKTGESSLNVRERAVRDAIRDKMIRWEQVRL
jgi:predicted Holliday junction resolvase-like endonuclease